jgi:hypothetical protein
VFIGEGEERLISEGAGITSIIEEREKITQHFNASGSSLLNENIICLFIENEIIV